MSTKCSSCGQAVYTMDAQIKLDGLCYHKGCAKCNDCGRLNFTSRLLSIFCFFVFCLLTLFLLLSWYICWTIWSYYPICYDALLCCLFILLSILCMYLFFVHFDILFIILFLAQDVKFHSQTLRNAKQLCIARHITSSGFTKKAVT